MWDPTADDETPGPPMPRVAPSTPPDPSTDETVTVRAPEVPPASAFSVVAPPPAAPTTSSGTESPRPSSPPSVTPPPILSQPKPTAAPPPIVAPVSSPSSSPPTTASAPPTPPTPTPRRWPLFLLALATIVASGVVSWFVASEVAEEPTSTNAVPIVEDIAGDGVTDGSATPITGNTIAPTQLDQAPVGGIGGDFLASEPFAAAAAKIAPSVVQLTLDNGLGSGVIIDESGYILTAAHVVGTTTDLDVILFDGSTVPGTVVGTHAPTDVAVVQIDGEGLDLVVAPLADGDDVRVGQLAVAVGSPFGFDQTVTAGIISAVDRVVNSVSMVQTDAPINPGNSGGPLIDLQGRVVGINDLIFTQSGSNAGVGFAISRTCSWPCSV